MLKKCLMCVRSLCHVHQLLLYAGAMLTKCLLCAGTVQVTEAFLSPQEVCRVLEVGKSTVSLTFVPVVSVPSSSLPS